MDKENVSYSYSDIYALFYMIQIILPQPMQGAE
jgi:hypothetical protein